MAATKTFPGVTSSVWYTIKTMTEKEQGTKYDPPEGHRGTSTTPTPVGVVVLGFEFDEVQSTVTYSIHQKPVFVSEELIWSTIEKGILRCQSSS
jgi:hypothetical protein